MVEGIHDQREVGSADQQRPLPSAGVEEPVPGIKRNCKQAPRPPFKAVFLALREFDLRTAPSLQDVDHFFVKMTLGRARRARTDLDQEHVAEIAAPLEMQRRALHADAEPVCRLHLKEVDSIVLDDWNSLLVHPLEIRIDSVAHSIPPIILTHMSYPRVKTHGNNSDLITTGTTPDGS